jgi:hypothetical protein
VERLGFHRVKIMAEIGQNIGYIEDILLEPDA